MTTTAPGPNFLDPSPERPIWNIARRRVRRNRRVKTKIFFFAVLCGDTPGCPKKKPKTPDALDVLDVGSDRTSISAGGSPEAMWSAAGFHNFGFTDFPIADAQISELGVCCRPTADPQILKFSSGSRHIGVIDIKFHAWEYIEGKVQHIAIIVRATYHDICASHIITANRQLCTMRCTVYKCLAVSSHRYIGALNER